MHAIELLKNPAKIPIKPVYAVFGDDAYLRHEALAALCHAALEGEDDDLAITKFAGEQASLADVLDEVRTLPFLSKRRVALVEGADPFVTAHRKELEAYVENPSKSGILILSVKLWPSNTKLAKGVEKSGLSVECKGPNERELAPWLVHLARSRFQAQLDNDTALLLIELVGPEAGQLVSELEKLSIYAGPGKKIQRDDVAKHVGAGRIETIWKVLDAATTGKGALALEHLDRLIGSGEHPVGLLAAMSVSLLKVHHAGQLRRARRDLKNACREAGIPFHAVEKTHQQHAHLGPTRVAQLPKLLLQADLDLKGSSQLPPRAVLEALIVRLSQKRKD